MSKAGKCAAVAAVAVSSHSGASCTAEALDGKLSLQPWLPQVRAARVEAAVKWGAAAPPSASAVARPDTTPLCAASGTATSASRGGAEGSQGCVLLGEKLKATPSARARCKSAAVALSTSREAGGAAPEPAPAAAVPLANASHACASSRVALAAAALLAAAQQGDCC